MFKVDVFYNNFQSLQEYFFSGITING